MAEILAASRRASVDLPEAGSPQISTSRVAAPARDGRQTRLRSRTRGYGALNTDGGSGPKKTSREAG